MVTKNYKRVTFCAHFSYMKWFGCLEGINVFSLDSEFECDFLIRVVIPTKYSNRTYYSCSGMIVWACISNRDLKL